MLRQNHFLLTIGVLGIIINFHSVRQGIARSALPGIKPVVAPGPGISKYSTVQTAPLLLMLPAQTVRML
jgi:hypothetical protein